MKQMNRKKILPLLLCLCMTGLSGAAHAADPAKAASAPLPKVDVVVVKHISKLEQGINTTSTIAALEEVTLIPKVTGRVSNIAVDKGDFVEGGDTLVVLDSRTQEAEYDSLNAQVAVNKAELAQAKVSLADAKREFDRYSRLRKSGYATQQEYDTRSTTYQAAVAAEAKAAAAVKMAEANLNGKAVNLSEYVLMAPITGIIMEDYDLTLGTLVSPTTNVMRIGRVDRLKANVNIPERDISRLRLGMEAEFTLESIPGEKFYGRVTMIDPYINTSTRTLKAEITIDNRATGFRLKPGMFARVLLIETSASNPLAVPSEAIRSDGTVLVVTDGRVEVRAITLAGAVKDGLVPVSAGLELGEDVIVSGGKKLQGGEEVDFTIVDGNNNGKYYRY